MIFFGVEAKIEEPNVFDEINALYPPAILSKEKL
jgi:hypothetical protein